MKVVNNNYSDLMNYSEQFIGFMRIYRFPMILNINYMRSYLNIGNQAKVNKTIILNTQLMKDAALEEKTLKTLFDPELYTHSQYTPSGFSTESLNLSYSHIDLFYTIVNSIVSMNSSKIDLLRT